jgi:hypothetical protein
MKLALTKHVSNLEKTTGGTTAAIERRNDENLLNHDGTGPADDSKRLLAHIFVQEIDQS